MRESQPEVPIEAAAEQEMELPEQTTPLLRKLVVLGDTRAPEAIVPLINSTPGQVSLLIHEATDCCIPHTVDPEGITGRNRTVDSVHATSMERGHSTPDMAGQFANAIEADRLILNHIGGRFVIAFSTIYSILTEFQKVPSTTNTDTRAARPL